MQDTDEFSKVIVPFNFDNTNLDDDEFVEEVINFWEDKFKKKVTESETTRHKTTTIYQSIKSMTAYFGDILDVIFYKVQDTNFDEFKQDFIARMANQHNKD
jgi:hypothetical protein